MADDPLGLTPDPSNPDQKVPDYLGKESPLAFKGQPALPVTGASAFGAPSGPIGTGGGGTPLSGGAFRPGGGGFDFGSLARLILEGGLDAAKLLGGAGGELGTRGDTAGVSLSDYLRSLAGAEETDTLAEVSGGELALGAGDVGSEVGTQAAETALEAGLDIPLEGLGWTAAFTIPIIEQFFGKDISLPFSGDGRARAQLHETKGIRKDFGTAWPILKGAAQDLGRFAGLKDLPPDQRREALLSIIGGAGQQISQFPAISQFMSTEGGRQSGGGRSLDIAPVDVSGLAKTSGGLETQALLSAVLGIDLLGQMGPLPTEEEMRGTPWRNPMGESVLNTISQLGESAGIPSKTFRGDPNYDASAARAFDQSTGQWYAMGPDGWQVTGAPPSRPITEEESAALNTPGQVVPTLRAIFTSVNPDFDSTPLGKMLADFEGGGTETTGGTEGGPFRTPFTPLPGAEPSGDGMTTGGPLTAPFTPLPGQTTFGNVASAAMSGGGGGMEQAAEQLGVAA